jgi:hypothetical protein
MQQVSANASEARAYQDLSAMDAVFLLAKQEQLAAHQIIADATSLYPAAIQMIVDLPDWCWKLPDWCWKLLGSCL